MRNFCTLSDKEYIYQGLSLLGSLRRHAGDFVLYYLCLDDETKTAVLKFGGKDVMAVGLAEFESADPQISVCRNRPAITGSGMSFDSHSQFCWAMTPCWTSHLLNKVVDQGGITYLDSDLFFRQSLAPIFEAMGNKSIGIFEHRHITGDEPAGKYNVGMVYFRGDEISKKCALWWRGVMLDPNNQWAKKYGVCGDQKYLELFASLFGQDNLAFPDNTIGHGAPWNFRLYQYDGDYIVWNGKRQLVFFNHFSHFVPDFEHDTYKVAYGKEWGDCVVHEQVRKWYDEYFAEAKRVREKLRRAE